MASPITYRRRLLALALALVTAAVLSPAPGAAAPAPTPAFVDGMAQPAFADDEVIRQDIWVETTVDSDRDGRLDRTHIEVARPASSGAGAKLPVIMEASPYFAGGNPITNHDVDVELYVPPGRGRDTANGMASQRSAGVRSLSADEHWIGPGRYEEYFLPRGFAFVYAESLGSGESTGCPTSGGRNETLGIKAVVDWLNGRATGYDADGNAVTADWTTGQVGMMGVSYNGTLPNAVAATGVQGLETIVPIAAISSWYDYYRAEGLVVAPGGYQGEDADVLAEFVLTRANREVCNRIIGQIEQSQDRITGDYSRFWAERDYLRDIGKVRASVFAAHGLNDWNVKTRHVAQWYEALARRGVERKILLHQSGHIDPYSLGAERWLTALNRWFSHWLHGVDNGVTDEPRATIQREDGSWTEEADWPSRRARATRLHLRASGDNSVGRLSASRPRGRQGAEIIVDDASFSAEDLAAAATSPHRLLYRSPALREAVRASGTATVAYDVAFSEPAANVSAALVDYAPDGSSFLITEGWTDPQNRENPARTKRIRVGRRYTVSLAMQADDYLFQRGHRIGVVLLSSDHDYTLRPRPGIRLTVDPARTRVQVPIVGGRRALRDALAR